jgi:hypothetical protein
MPMKQKKKLKFASSFTSPEKEIYYLFICDVITWGKILKLSSNYYCRRRSPVGNTWAGWGPIPVVSFPDMSVLILRATSLSLQGEQANIGKG